MNDLKRQACSQSRAAQASARDREKGFRPIERC